MEQLLATKLYIPSTRLELVSRPHLVERIDEGLHRKLTMISAPAGFGKTTLVSEWVEYIRSKNNKQSEVNIAWLSLDENDNDPFRFLTYFITSLRQVEGTKTEFGDGALSMLRANQPPSIETILIALINDLAEVSDKIVLVLDDYHLISATLIDDALTFLLEYLPPQLHLVISTRVDPQLPIARLRASSQLNELRAEELRFTSSEASEFLNDVMGLALSADDIAALETRTEGWIAGLQLAAISMQGRDDPSSLIKSFTGSHRLVLDYLIEEVLDQQSESIQHFLLDTAILNRLNGPLCDALTGQTNGQETLEMLDHANLFIVPLDEERSWYRYHHLFSDLLRQRLKQTASELLPNLHKNASEWFEQNGFPDDAIDHSLQCDDFEQAASLIEDQADVIWGRGEHPKLYRYLEKLPEEVLLTKPQLCIFQATKLFISGKHVEAELSLSTAEKILEQSSGISPGSDSRVANRISDSKQATIKGRIAHIRAELAFYRGDFNAISTYSRQALKHLPKEDLSWRSLATVALGDAYVAAGDTKEACRVHSEGLELSKASGNIYATLLSSLKLAINLRYLGQLQKVKEICQQYLILANESGMSRTDAAGCLLSIWAEVLAEENDMDVAIEHARKGTKLTERSEDGAILGWGYICLIRVLFSRGKTMDAEEIIQITKEFNRRPDVPHWITNRARAWQTRLMLAQGNINTASKWAAESGLNIDGEIQYLEEFEYFILARLLIAQERLIEATGLLRRLIKAAEEGGRTASVIEILILQALTLKAQGNTNQAIATLEQALNLAKPEGFFNVFIDEGPPMARLLFEAISKGVAPEYANHLLAAFQIPKHEPTGQEISEDAGVALIEALSLRETEVLALVAEGLTNQGIAARLYLSENTVKVHIRNIFRKLSVNNRTEAVSKAKALGILI